MSKWIVKAMVRNVMVLTLLAGLLNFGSGCTTSSTAHVEPLQASAAPGVDLRQYSIATVVPFVVAAGGGVDPLVGSDFADEIRDRLNNSYAGLFDRVRPGPVLGTNGELVVTGTITKYNAGNVSERALLIGLGAASFDAELTLKDAQSGRVLMTAQVNKLWAWGGAAGISKRVENMMFEAAAAIDATLAHEKGWQALPK